MVEKQFPTWMRHMSIIYVNTGHKPKITREELFERAMTQEPLISDEEAFERHLVRKWKDDRKMEYSRRENCRYCDK